MREIKIFVIVACIVGVIYYGVEPLAHKVMHPPTASSDYEFKDLKSLGEFNIAMGDASNGKELFANNCAACHTLNSQPDASLNIRNPKTIQAAEEGGVVPPDLSNAGLIFHEQFLAHFIKDPVRASLLDGKFQVSCEGLEGDALDSCNLSNEGKASYPMSAFNGALNDGEISDIVAYLKQIAPKAISDKEVFMESCNRCHSVAYDKNQYDSRFFASHNAKVGSLIAMGESKGDDELVAHLEQNEPDLLDHLLAMARYREKDALTESELDEKLEALSVKGLEEYGGALALLKASIIESSFNKPGLAATTNKDDVKAYLGNTPPDLSMMIRAKGAHELAAFINNPQKVPLVDIQQAVLNKLVKDKQNEDREELASKGLSDSEMQSAMQAIDLRDAAYYGITLPANTMRSEWQSEDDYTNMARSLGVMPFGKAMPRVGLTKEAEQQVVSYLETIGDSKKADRDSLGWKIVAFFILLSALAYLWKSKIWRDLH